MRKFVLMAIASFLSCTSIAQAFWPEATDSSLKIGVGYRQDRFQWETRANSEASGSSYSNSNYESNDFPIGVESKNKWKNLNIWQIALSGNYVTCDNVYLRASGDYGWITSGKVTDDDYLTFGSNSANTEIGYAPMSSSSSKVKGNVYDVKFAVGYQFQLCDDTFTIAPLVGYSWHGQRFRDSHLRHFVFDANNEDLSAVSRSRSSYSSSYDSYYSGSGYSYYSYSGNHSSYHTRWNGPFIGFDFDYSICCDWNLFGGYEFHFAEFHGKAKWGQRSDICGSFNQRSKNAYGNYFDIGVQWAMCDCWTVDLKGEFQFWRAHHGHDRAKICQTDVGNVKRKCYLQIPTRNTEWCSAGVTLDLGMTF